LLRRPQWHGTAVAPASVVRQSYGATLRGAASLELENMLKLKVKIMLKLEIINISANKLKIK
jgi:hypothetical protein